MRKSRKERIRPDSYLPMCKMMNLQIRSNVPHFVLAGSNLTNVKGNMTAKKRAAMNWVFCGEDTAGQGYNLVLILNTFIDRFFKYGFILVFFIQL